jgi:hypothetical protein
MADAVEISSAFPMQRPVPVTGEVAQMFRDGLAARGITELPHNLVTEIDTSTRTAQLANGETLPTPCSSLGEVARTPSASKGAGDRSSPREQPLYGDPATAVQERRVMLRGDAANAT